VEFREDLIAFYPTDDATTRTFLETACHPVRLVAVVEALVHEGVMSRTMGSRIEDRIMASPWGADWQAWEETPALEDLSGYIEDYWH